MLCALSQPLCPAQPDPAETAFRQGSAAFERGRPAEALPHFEKAAGLQPRKALYWKALGVAYAAQRDYAGAIEPLGRACELDPRLTDACYFYGRALYAADRYEAALAALRRALPHDRPQARAQTGIAQALEALNRPEEAERHFRSALALRDGFERPARIAYGKFLIRYGRLDEAVAMLQSAMPPETPEARFELGRAHLQAGRPGEARRELERAVELNPSDAATRLLLAKAYRRLKLTAEATRQEQAAFALQGSLTDK